MRIKSSHRLFSFQTYSKMLTKLKNLVELIALFLVFYTKSNVHLGSEALATSHRGERKGNSMARQQQMGEEGDI